MSSTQLQRIITQIKRMWSTRLSMSQWQVILCDSTCKIFLKMRVLHLGSAIRSSGCANSTCEMFLKMRGLRLRVCIWGQQFTLVDVQNLLWDFYIGAQVRSSSHTLKREKLINTSDWHDQSAEEYGPYQSVVLSWVQMLDPGEIW